MASPDILKHHEQLFGDNPHVVSRLISEPLTLEDGTQYAVFHQSWSPSGNVELAALSVGENHQTGHYRREEYIIDLGDGDFHRGVIEFVKETLPRRGHSVMFVDLETGIEYEEHFE